MQIKIFDNYEALSVAVAEAVLAAMDYDDRPLFCPASGDTPVGVYKVLAGKYKANQFNPAQWTFVGLDEWVGLNGGDEGSCRYSIEHELLVPLQVTAGNYFFFDGRAADLADQCLQAEEFIAAHQGINVALLGLGMNGHIAMNEPGCDMASRTQVVKLHSVTRQVGQKYFKQEKVLDEGITLGLGTLFESRRLILIVSGAHKAAIVRKLLEEPSTNELPGSLLLRHPDITVYLDVDAARLLTDRREAE